MSTLAADGAGASAGNALASTAVKAAAQGIMEGHEECGALDSWHGDGLDAGEAAEFVDAPAEPGF